jgi:hypothetical protein
VLQRLGYPMRPNSIAAEIGIASNTANQRLLRLEKKQLVIADRAGYYSLHPALIAKNSDLVSDRSDPSGLSDCQTLSEFHTPDGSDYSDRSDGSDTKRAFSANGNGWHPPGELPPELDLPELEPEEGLVRRRLYNLAWARGWPALKLGMTEVAEGEPSWQETCRVSSLPWVEKFHARLEGMAGNG